MCDAYEYAVGAILARRICRGSHVMYYASRNLDYAQSNYITHKK